MSRAQDVIDKATAQKRVHEAEVAEVERRLAQLQVEATKPVDNFCTSTDQRTKIESSNLQRKNWDVITGGKLCQHSPDSTKHQEKWDTTPPKWKNHETTVAFFFAYTQDKAGTHIDDFLQ